MQMVHVMAVITAKPGLRARILELFSANVPAVLAEVSCLSNPAEAQLLGQALYRQHIAQALSRGLRAYAREVAAGDTGEDL